MWVMEVIKMKPQKGQNIVPFIAGKECILVIVGTPNISVYHMNAGECTDDVVRLAEFKKMENVDLFVTAYVDSMTTLTFDDVLREAMTSIKDINPDIYEAYKQHHFAALKIYRELQPMQHGKVELAQILVSMNVFQRKLQKFMEKHTHLLP